jgi:hypothetical protein
VSLIVRVEDLLLLGLVPVLCRNNY